MIKQLAKYLADYVEYEYHWRGDELEDVIKQGIDTFELEENVSVKVKKKELDKRE